MESKGSKKLSTQLVWLQVFLIMWKQRVLNAPVVMRRESHTLRIQISTNEIAVDVGKARETESEVPPALTSHEHILW